MRFGNQKAIMGPLLGLVVLQLAAADSESKSGYVVRSVPDDVDKMNAMLGVNPSAGIRTPLRDADPELQPPSEPELGEPVDCSTLLDTIASRSDLSTLLGLAEDAGLADALSSTTAELTLLAPNNKAFSALLDSLAQGESAALRENPDAIAEILQLHVIEGKFRAQDLTSPMTVTTLAGAELLVAIPGDGTISFTAPACGTTSTVLIPNFGSCSSTLHIIDTVLAPEGGCTPGADVRATMQRFDDMMDEFEAFAGPFP